MKNIMRVHWLYRWQSLLARLFFIAMLSIPAHAGPKIIEPGEIIELGKDEGILAFAADSDAAGFRIRVKRSGGLFSYLSQERQGGLSVTLMVVPSGEYRFTELLQSNDTYFKMDDTPNMRFNVMAQRINYPGDFKVISMGVSFRGGASAVLNQARFAVVNRALRSKRAIEGAFPELSKRYPMRYSGQFPDPFLEQLASAGMTPTTPVSASVGPSKIKPTPLTLTGVPQKTADLFRRGGTVSAALSPKGTWFARFETFVAQDGKFYDELQILDATSGKQKLVAKKVEAGRYDNVDIEWADNDTVLFTVVLSDGTSLVRALGPIDKPKAFFEQRIPGTGWVVDALPEVAQEFIYARSDGPFGGIQLYRIRLQELQSSTHLSSRWVLDRQLKNDWYWLVDASGTPQVALKASAANHSVVSRNRSGGWRKVLEMPNSNRLSLAGYGDSDQVYLLTNYQRDQVELVLLDLKTGVLSTKLAIAGHDLIAPIRAGRRVIGARDRNAGVLRAHYFATQKSTAVQAPKDLAGHYQLHLLGSAGDKDLYYANSPMGVGKTLLLSADGAWLTVGIEQPWLEKTKFAKTSVFAVSAQDGLAIQGFLTVPEGAGPFPVLLMPHGGPIAVSDNADFDPYVQFWALRGYAVVRANYRGSSGFGTKFLESGKRQWGKQIEADIGAVLAQALQDPRLDKSRVGIWGASYGGYSALISALSQPERFPCAVSVAGVTDLPLMFTSSDWAQNSVLVDEMKEIVGDPKQAMADLIAISPLYQLAQLQSQVLLMHGDVDERVSVEHTQRYAFRAKQLGKTVAVRYFEGEGHSFEQLESVVQMQEQSAAFLGKCLNIKTAVNPALISTKP
jgi:dipeptidyl aminopeptidase/acylaminoacyl peptidase